MYRLGMAALVVAVAPLVSQAQTWKTITSDNFSVQYNSIPEDAATKATARAEADLATVIAKWKFKAPSFASKPVIYLHADSKSLNQYAAVGTAAGCTVCNFEPSRAMITIHVRLDSDTIWQDVLPHEISHAVSYSQYGKLPNWLNEGIAGQSESGDMVKRYIRGAAKADRFWAAETLMESREYPKGDTMLFYSESVSLVNYLVGLKGEAEFTGFVRTLQKDGSKAALKTHYDLTYKALEKGWYKTME